MFINPLNCIDFYKADHRRQYPEGTTLVYSNFTPRSNRLSNLPFNNDYIVFFGLQYFIKEYLQDLWNNNFFAIPKEVVINTYKRRMDDALGKDAIPVDHIEALHDLGYLPLCINALPEGSIVKPGVPVLTIYNTHPDFYWLTNYIESVLSCMLWKSCTSATTARFYRKELEEYCKLTGGIPELVDFQAHDFSFRGMSGLNDAMMSGMGHLTSFKGTDTVLAIDAMEQIYDCTDVDMIGGSVPATEHSVMCMGSKESEIDTFKRLITEVYPNGIVSIVSDTWDFWKVVTEYVAELKSEILSRDGKLVIRPDSGDPVHIICGDPNAEEGSPAHKGAVECLWEIFGGTVTETGHKLLDSHISLIYGDSITPQRAHDILDELHMRNFCSSNIVFGVGSYTYEYVTRDTYGFAVKSTYGEINGEPHEIFKDPVTDSGEKKSAKGWIKVSRDPEDEYYLVDQSDKVLSNDCYLQSVYVDGAHLINESLKDIRQRIKETL